MAAEKTNIIKTGGGQYSAAALSATENKFVGLIETQARGLTNAYDDDFSNSKYFNTHSMLLFQYHTSFFLS